MKVSIFLALSGSAGAWYTAGGGQCLLPSVLLLTLRRPFVTVLHALNRPKANVDECTPL